jgi:hypothetical protein
LRINEFEISASKVPLITPAGNCDVLDIVMHKNVRLSEIVSGILDSDHLPIVLQVLDHVRTKNLSDPVEKFID